MLCARAAWRPRTGVRGGDGGAQKPAISHSRARDPSLMKGRSREREKGGGRKEERRRES